LISHFSGSSIIFHELADYFFIRVVHVQKLFFREIAMPKREFQMNLRFRRFTFCIAKFYDERCFVATLQPRLDNICTN
jgi:hypothetical protein